MKQKLISIFAVFFISITLSGCLLGLGAAIGGAGGYWMAKEKNSIAAKKAKTLEKKIRFEERQKLNLNTPLNTTSGQLPQSQAMVTPSTQDKIIALNLNTQLLGGGLTKVITIYSNIQNGNVTLYGNVPNANVARRAVAIAQKTPGVRNVISHIVVIGFKITPTNTKAAQQQTSARAIQQPRQQQSSPRNPITQNTNAAARTKNLAPSPAQLLTPWDTPQQDAKLFITPEDTTDINEDFNDDTWDVPKRIRK